MRWLVLVLLLSGCSQINAFINGITATATAPAAADRVRYSLYADTNLVGFQEASPGMEVRMELSGGANTLAVTAYMGEVPLAEQRFTGLHTGGYYSAQLDGSRRLLGRAKLRLVGFPADTTGRVYLYVDTLAGYPPLQLPAPEQAGFSLVGVYDLTATEVQFPTAPNLRLVVVAGGASPQVATYPFNGSWLGSAGELAFVWQGP